MTLGLSMLTTVYSGAITILASLLLAQSVGAQERSLIINGAPSCSTCTIELTHVATAGRPDDPIRFFSYSELYRGPGNTIIANNTIPSGGGAVSSVFLLDSAGRYLKQIATPGSGGIQFGGWSWVLGIGRGDSVYFRDRNGKHYVLGPSLEAGRTLPHYTLGVIRPGAFPGAFRLALPNGTFVAGPGTAPRQAELAAPLALVSEDGRLLKKVGQLTPEEGQNLGFSTRSLSLSKDRTHFWVLRRNQYDLQRFTIEGERDLTLKVDGSPWMRAWLEVPQGTYTSLENVRDAGSGRLWVNAQVPVLGASTRPNINTASWPTSLELRVSTIIEMIDFERGSVIASRRFEREIYFFLDDKHVARQKQDAAGFVTWDIYRIELRER